MERKYEMTEETLNWRGCTLHRIKAMRDFSDVVTGDLGGWIEKEENLSHAGDCWVSEYGKVCDNAKVCGDARIFDDANVFGYAQVFGNARVHGRAEIFMCAEISGDTNIFGEANVFGYSKINGNAVICGDAKIFGYANVRYNAYVPTSWDYFTVGPIGSRDDFTTFYKTKEETIMVTTGCFCGTIQAFEEAVKKKHKTFRHSYLQYMSICTFAKRVLRNDTTEGEDIFIASILNNVIEEIIYRNKYVSKRAKSACEDIITEKYESNKILIDQIILNIKSYSTNDLDNVEKRIVSIIADLIEQKI